MKNFSKIKSVILLKSRLSRRIVIWVFTSIVVVEFMILMPSVYRRQQELLEQLAEVGLATMQPLVRWQQFNRNPDVALAAAQQLFPHKPVLGGVIYLSNGDKIGTFGEEMPNLSFTMVKEQHRRRLQSPDGDRYDVAWIAQPGNREYPLCQSLVMILRGGEQTKPRFAGTEMVLILRMDASGVRWEIKKYVVRIAGLVAIICLFVTLTTMVAIGSNLIVPILELRQALLKVAATKGEEQTNAEGNLMLVKRDDELGDVMDAFNWMRAQIYNHLAAIKDRELKLESLVEEVDAARDRAEKLLLNILPEPIAEQLKREVYPIAESFAEATVLFADIVGFTQLAATIPPTEIVNLLNQVFTAFDQLAEVHGLEKIKTIGDAYMVVGGVPLPRSDHASAIAAMALDMQQAIQNTILETGQPLNIRIGINSGPVVAGVIGIKKFIYDLWGDTVNIASRMESHGITGCIQVAESTYTLLRDLYHFEPRGTIEVKGKGMMRTYLLTGRKP